MYDNDIMLNNLDARDLQNYQEIFCEAQRVFMSCYNSKDRNVTRLSGRKDELKMLNDAIGKITLKNIIAQSVEKAKLEKRIVYLDTKFINVKVAGVPNIKNNNYEGCWSVVIIYNQDEYLKNSENQELVGELYPTKGKFVKVTFNGAKRMLGLLTFFSELFISAVYEKNSARAKIEEINKKDILIKSELHRKDTLTKIMQELESDDEIEKVLSKVINYITKYLDLSLIDIVKVDSDKTVLESISRYIKSEDESLISKPDEMILDLLKEYDGASMLLYDKDGDNPESKLEKYPVRRVMAIPIVASENPEIYAFFAEISNAVVFDVSVTKFLFDVTKLIQNFIFKRIAKNSLVSSYTALKEVLDNLGSSIFVMDKETNEILFANNVLICENDNNNSYELYYDYLFNNETGMLREFDPSKIDKLYVEKYDHKSEKWYDISFNDITWVDGSKVSLCNIVDITEKKKYQKKIEFQANNDFLTGLYNRMKCEEDLKNLIDEAIENNKNGSVLFIDLDNFKNINDGLGHKYGDVLLQSIATALKNIPGIENRCYRVGGDEFIILIEPDKFDERERIVNDILELFEKPWQLKDTEYYCTMSMGIVEYPENGNDVNELIKKSDIAMYDAKKNGKNGFRHYNVGEDMSSLLKLDLEKNIRVAVANGCKEFEVYIQPIVDSKTEKCLGGEALVRWNSEKLGFMSPMEFIPLAEHLGLIIPIGEHVLKNACLINKRWSDKGIDLSINVNLSVVQLLADDIVDKINNILKETKVNPKNIVLEVTESLAINDIEKMKKIIKQIKKLGVRIALDDFGTGYSSLNYIKQMDLDTIKVDRTFIRDIALDDYAQVFVKLITELSEKLSMKVCVEGVEIKSQLETLRKMNISMIQGYYYGKPMKIEEFEEKYFDFEKGKLKDE